MKKINKRSIASKVIKSEASSLNIVAKKLDANFDKACDVIMNCKGKVITIGLGKSGYIAAKSAATFSSTGTPSIFLHAAEALHGDMGVISKNDIVIFYSNSGETKELLLIIPLLKILRIPILSITGSKKSTLSKASDIVIDSGVKIEACPLNLTPTSSVITALSISDALAITLLQCKGFTSKDFAKSHPQGMLGKRLLKKVSDIMYIKKLPFITDNLKLIETIDIITKFNFGIVIILNRTKKILGLFTDGDLRRVLKIHPDVSQLMIYDLMTKNPIIVSGDLLAAEAINIMEEKAITSLLVSNQNNQLIGLVTFNGLLKSGIE